MRASVAPFGLLVGAVAIGGAAGSVARLLAGEAIQQRIGTSFPVGTLVINVSGSLLLGFIIRIALDVPAVTPTTRALLTTGFCGGFTTFSTFSYDTAVLLENGTLIRASVYALASVLLSVA